MESVEPQGKERKSDLLLWTMEPCGSWEQTVVLPPSRQSRRVSSISLPPRQASARHASPFPPLPTGFVLSLTCMWISSYISVMPRREVFFLMQTYPNFIVPSVCFLGRAPLFHPTLPKPQFKTPMNIPLQVSEKAKQENLLLLYSLYLVSFCLLVVTSGVLRLGHPLPSLDLASDCSWLFQKIKSTKDRVS